MTPEIWESQDGEGGDGLGVSGHAAVEPGIVMRNCGAVFLQKSVQHAVTGFLFISRAVQEVTMEISGFQIPPFLLLIG